MNAIQGANAIKGARALAAITFMVASMGPANATVGSGTTIEVLGFEPREGKIFTIRDSGYRQCLYLTRVSGRSAGKSQFVKSYYPGGRCPLEPQGAVLAKIEKRIKRLRKRLVAMPVVARAKRPSSDTTLPLRIRGVTLKRKVLRSWRDKDFNTPCRDIELRVIQRKKKLVGMINLTTCGPRARVTALYRLPKRAELYAVVSAKPDMFEGGYENQYPVLLRPRKGAARR
jgi:hypothetical protein